MGACGCGDFCGGLRFPGPDGVVYVLEIYPGCDDCHTPAGITIHRNVVKDDEFFFGHDDPEVPFVDWGGRREGDPKFDSGYTFYSTPIFDPEKAVARLAKELGDLRIGALDEDAEYDSVKDAIEDLADGALRDAIGDTLEEGRKLDEARRGAQGE